MASGFVEVTVEKIDGDNAALKLSNGETVNWPVRALPDGAQEGTTVVLLSKTYATQTDPKTLLNELLKEDSNE